VSLVRVVDGDTIRVQLPSGEEEAVRYIGIDTPERGRCFFDLATEANARLLERGDLRLVHDVERRDRYGRLLAYVYAGQTFVNAELVRQGFAAQYTVPPNVEHADEFRLLAAEAREADRGLWSECEEHPGPG
jgi:micrococcal nuclease